jgi:hypothetical protein
MAFDTRYDVSTQVDSSEPADKPPAMWGSATLAIDVSRTSMKVASVTVTAITQGLIEPSGIRSFDRSLWRIAFRCFLLLATPQEISLPCLLFRDHRHIRVHPRPQYRLLLRNRIDDDLYRYALDYFHVIARGILGRQ